jgi:hypothetical protein
MGNHQRAPSRYDGVFNSGKSIAHPWLVAGIYGKSKLTNRAFSLEIKSR